ncbi:MAG: CapA family protein [Planctomycetes bacterium]|nr:CapA family protein [Planctomycetota bacterium]
MNLPQTHKHSNGLSEFRAKGFLTGLLTALFCVFCAIGCLSPKPQPQFGFFQQLDPEMVSGKVQLRILFGGDTAWGENYQLQDQSPHRTGERFEKFCLRSIEKVQPLAEKSDISVVNLETPVTDANVSPFRGMKAYIHWSDMELAPKILHQLNVQSVSLGNNHSLDYGVRGLRDTYNTLSNNGIDCFGGGKTKKKPRAPGQKLFRSEKTSSPSPFWAVCKYTRDTNIHTVSTPRASPEA